MMRFVRHCAHDVVALWIFFVGSRTRPHATKRIKLYEKYK